MNKNKKQKKDTVKRQKQDGLVSLLFWVLPEKRERITKEAKKRGESRSYYLNSITD